MSAITLQIPDDLAGRIRGQQDRLAEILELGLRELNAENQAGFAGAAEVLELLASLPTPEEVVRLRPSAALQARISELLQKNRAGALTSSEQQEWERHEYLEHLVRIAKSKARLKLASAQADG